MWLNVICQGLRSKNRSPDLTSFETALSLLSQVSLEDTNLEFVRSGWQKVIGAIAIHNRDTALKLLNEEVWLQFIRLGITQPPIESPQQFISKYCVAPKRSDKNVKNHKQSTSNKKPKNKK
ncbi:hypothetical protein [Floridanema evergladense]|uniref:Uncharacterized protein n=1 Tax=Floridaenema evergladense BLCC-F167 TaxID=3153639 RepID=A0ABV4WVH9_9CYAN